MVWAMPSFCFPLQTSHPVAQAFRFCRCDKTYQCWVVRMLLCLIRFLFFLQNPLPVSSSLLSISTSVGFGPTRLLPDVSFSSVSLTPDSQCTHKWCQTTLCWTKFTASIWWFLLCRSDCAVQEPRASSCFQLAAWPPPVPRVHWSYVLFQHLCLIVLL